MKTFYLIFLLMLLTSKLIFPQWYSGTTADLRGVWFADSLKGWACGDSGIVLHTSNGGKQWERQNSFVSAKLEDVFFLDSTMGWACGDSGTVIHTGNGGVLWIKQQTMITKELHCIQFVTPLIGFSTGEQGSMLETFNGGMTWETVMDSGDALIILFWINHASGTGVVSNPIPAICTQLFTVDAGMIWAIPIVITYTNDVCGFLNTSLSIIRDYYWDVGPGGSAIWISIYDLGYPYVEFIIWGETDDTLDLQGVTLERSVEPLKLWAVGQQGWIISSIDSGLTWQTVPGGVTADLYEVSFPCQNYGYAVGDSGIILHYDQATAVENSNLNLQASGNNFINTYPNPFNISTTVRYSISQSENIELTIYNSLGQKVKNLFSGYQQKGEYESRWDGTNEEGQLCSSGIYIAELRTRQSSLFNKLILLK